MGLDAGSDVRALVLVWQLGSKDKPGELSKQEFVSGIQLFKIQKCITVYVLQARARANTDVHEPFVLRVEACSSVPKTLADRT